MTAKGGHINLIFFRHLPYLATWSANVNMGYYIKLKLPFSYGEQIADRAYKHGGHVDPNE